MNEVEHFDLTLVVMLSLHLGISIIAVVSCFVFRRVLASFCYTLYVIALPVLIFELFRTNIGRSPALFGLLGSSCAILFLIWVNHKLIASFVTALPMRIVSTFTLLIPLFAASMLPFWGAFSCLTGGPIADCSHDLLLLFGAAVLLAFHMTILEPGLIKIPAPIRLLAVPLTIALACGIAAHAFPSFGATVNAPHFA